MTPIDAYEVKMTFDLSKPDDSFPIVNAYPHGARAIVFSPKEMSALGNDAMMLIFVKEPATEDNRLEHDTYYAFVKNRQKCTSCSFPFGYVSYGGAGRTPLDAIRNMELDMADKEKRQNYIDLYGKCWTAEFENMDAINERMFDNG